ncbi:protein arginine N-methyltransferase 5 [Thamnocephalis sphaerospora]|uniref:Protein arginine N-methyltransferase n=1 Tax=Thamnocephalis sphaerospora TaxID=78915 RepID=A0A4P9XZL8_9FUNG|nr:protein arginine N-methyltransferase 5 [Thamnocephalis sphaerospora]|eukprot:RKP11211.1 protein arginine N-methyltransferase 5 [Thamnocephalis sphaerospora]
MSDEIRIGLEVAAASAAELGVRLDEAKSAGYEFVASPLTNAALRQATQTVSAPTFGLPENRAFALDQVVLDRVDWADSVVGRHAAWADLSDAQTRIAAEMVLQREATWAMHLGVPATILMLPTELSRVPNVARYVNNLLRSPSYTQLWIQAPMTTTIRDETEGVASCDEDASWECWNLLRTLCGHNARVLLALELTADLPDEGHLQRWFAEPLVALVFAKDIWLRNAKGFPVLGKCHQATVRRMLKRQPQVIVRAGTHPGAKLEHYQQYVRHLARTQPPPNACEAFAVGYQDYLQAPLQPLMDNLESATYQVFEQDPVKYAQYEKAVYHALLDRVPAGSDVVTTVMVVGAGRGPLVTRSLAAADKAQRAVRVYAVEKNPNAYVTLQRMKQTQWQDRVTVIWSDMREWDAPIKADILVSELLGSFGDNELSPECLDGAQRFLKPDGISIPSSYTAYVAPLSSSKLYTEVAAFGQEARFETPYVVLFNAVHELTAPQPTWSFHHPLRDADTGDLIGNAKNVFTLAQSATIHGIAGYFDTVLYKDVTLSIHPATFSEGMFSWFPIYFPFKTPIYAPAGSKIETHFWRLTDCKKTWYEWSSIVTTSDASPESADSSSNAGSRTRLVGATPIHNVGGVSSWIGL